MMTLEGRDRWCLLWSISVNIHLKTVAVQKSKADAVLPYFTKINWKAHHMTSREPRHLQSCLQI